MQQEAPAAPPHKGPLVYRNYTQSELDAAYNQAAYAPNMALVHERRIALCETVRAHLGTPDRFSYGESDVEKLDVFRAKRADAPILVFIHGGAWRNGTAAENCYAAETFVRCGVTFVVLDFVMVQDAGNSLFPMVEQVRRGIAWAYKNAERVGGNRDRFYICGHSSGSHLGGCALIADWQKEHGLDPRFIKGATLCSGMYDLEPVSLSARSDYVAFTPAMVDALSAIRHIDRIATPVTLAYGTKETPEFQRQSREFAAALQAAGKPHRLLAGTALNHFEMGETYVNPFGLLGGAVLEQIGIALAPA